MQPMMGSSVPPPSTISVTPGMFESLRGTRPWVMFLGIMAFIGAGFMVLGALSMMVAGSAAGRSSVAGMGFGYIVMAVFYVVAGIYLVRYGGALKRLFDGGGAVALEEALASQKSFWKFSGILTVVMLVLVVVGVVIAMVFGAAAIAHMR